MPVTIHSYEDVSDIPESVRELVELMKRPLRGTQRLASLPSMTPLALAQLHRIPDRGSDADTGVPDDTLDKMSSVANLVLSTSRAIEESSRQPEARVMGDVPFSYPEGFDSESGECTMLVAFSADESLAFHLATVILRIKAREKDLIALYNEHKELYESKLKAGTYDKWAMPESKKTTVALPPPTTPLTRINETPE